MTGRNIALTRPGSHPGKKGLMRSLSTATWTRWKTCHLCISYVKIFCPWSTERSLYDNVLRSPSNISYSPLFFFTSIHFHFEIFAIFPIIFPFLPIIITVHHDTIFFFCFFFASRFDKKKLCHLLYHNYSTTFENRRALNNSRDVIDNIVSRGSPKISSTCCVFPRFFREFTRYRI